jgi:hypothetical protein
MKNRQMLLFFFLVFASISYAGDEDQKIIAKYCRPNANGETKGEINLNNSNPLKCETQVNNRWYFEYANSKCQIKNEAAVPDALFKSSEWENFLMKGFLSSIKKSPGLSNTTCSAMIVEDGKYYLQCNDKIDVTPVFQDFKKQSENAYLDGGRLFAKSPDPISLMDQFEQMKKNSNINNKPVVDLNPPEPSPTIEWDDIFHGKKIELVMDKETQARQSYLWGTPSLIPNETMIPKAESGKFIKLEPNYVNIDVKEEKKEEVIPIVENPPKDEGVVKEETPTEENKKESDPNCQEELKKEIAKLLEQDKNNIIGLQYELTVLKMASLVVGEKKSTLEALIKQSADTIAKADQGKIDQMRELYKKYGLPEDEQKIYDHLKEKSINANYYAKDKRFFNDDSSAFLMMYLQLNPSSNIKDSDISVLWLMDKVSKKAESQFGKYSSAHNRTNLSTRIAQYTDAINPKYAVSSEKLEEMRSKQKAKLDKEFLGLIALFKISNPACYNSLFSDGADECNLTEVEKSFNDLLVVQSKISSLDLVSVDAKLAGNVDKMRFQISRYVEEEP